MATTESKRKTWNKIPPFEKTPLIITNENTSIIITNQSILTKFTKELEHKAWNNKLSVEEGWYDGAITILCEYSMLVPCAKIIFEYSMFTIDDLRKEYTVLCKQMLIVSEVHVKDGFTMYKQIMENNPQCKKILDRTRIIVNAAGLNIEQKDVCGTCGLIKVKCTICKEKNKLMTLSNGLNICASYDHGFECVFVKNLVWSDTQVQTLMITYCRCS